MEGRGEGLKEGDLVLVGFFRARVGLMEGDIVGHNEGLLNVGFCVFWTLMVGGTLGDAVVGASDK